MARSRKNTEQTYGDEHIDIYAKMTTTQRLRWLEKAKEFVLKTTPKSAIRAYLKIRVA
jgi:hypothetical protein